MYLINKKDIKRKGKEKRTLGRPQRPQRVIAVPLRHFVKLLLLCDNCNIFSLRISKVLYNLPYRYLFFFFYVSNDSKGMMDKNFFLCLRIGFPLPSAPNWVTDLEARARQIRADYPATLRKNSFPLMTHIPLSFISPV